MEKSVPKVGLAYISTLFISKMLTTANYTPFYSQLVNLYKTQQNCSKRSQQTCKFCRRNLSKMLTTI